MDSPLFHYRNPLQTGVVPAIAGMFLCGPFACLDAVPRVPATHLHLIPGGIHQTILSIV